MTNLDTPTWVIVSGNRAYVAAFFSSAISVFDVSNPADPVLIRQVRDDSVQPGSPFTRLQWPYQMQLVGTRLYVAARGDHALNILDVSNPANPTLVNAIVDASVVPSSPFARLRNANWVEVLGNTAYVIAGAFSTTLGSLTIIDISNPASPVKLAEVNDDSVQTNSAFTKLSGAWAVKVVGDIAFVTSVFDNAVTAIDVSNPGNPRLLKEFVNGMEGINTLSFTEGLAARGETVYVAGGGSGALNMFSAHAMLGLKVDGFVGIGTATPRTELDVAGTVSARNVQWASGSQLVSDQGGSIELGDSSLANSTPYIDFHFGVNGAQNYNVRLINDAPSQLSLLGNFSVSGSGILDKADVNSGSISPGLIFGNASGEGIASKRTAGAGQWGLDFYTAFINRMTIANNGNVGIGTGSPQTRFHVFGADGLQLRLQNSVNNRFWTIYSESFNDSGNLLFVPGTGVFGYIRRTDGLYFSGSDEQLKREITPLSNVLDRVLQLRPVTYQFRGEPENTARTLGLIAQEVEPLFPEVVGEHAGTKSLAYSGLVPAAIGAIQELNQKLSEETSSLRERLARKEAEIAELHRAVAELAQLVQGKASK
jgi:hypothetical protein